MIAYIMGYAKPEEILKYINNRYFSRYMNQHFGIWIGIFKLRLEKQIACLY